MQGILICAYTRAHMCAHTHAPSLPLQPKAQLPTSWKKELPQLPVSQSPICNCARASYWCYRHIWLSWAQLFKGASSPQLCKEPCLMKFYHLGYLLSYSAESSEFYVLQTLHPLQTFLGNSSTSCNADTITGRGPHRGCDAQHQLTWIAGLQTKNGQKT